jgi:hypothetical protein
MFRSQAFFAQIRNLLRGIPVDFVNQDRLLTPESVVVRGGDQCQGPRSHESI